jgi:hypothetical protein
MSGSSPVRSSGTVSGFEIASNLELLMLRSGGGGEIEVVEDELLEPSDVAPLVTWVRRLDNPFEATLYPVDQGYLMWVPGMGGFGVDPTEGRLVLPVGADPVRREARAWGVPISLLARAVGDLSVHGSSVEVAGRALLFCGPSRFGKTTLAAAFLAAGHRVLSEDLTRCRPGGVPSVFPGPALLRLRRDVHERLGPFASTTVAADEEDRVFLVLDDELRGSGAAVPLAGIVILRRGTPDLQLYRVEHERFLPELFSMSFTLPTDADRARAFRAAVDVVGSVPVWVLDRPLRFELVGSVVEALIDRCLG